MRSEARSKLSKKKKKKKRKEKKEFDHIYGRNARATKTETLQFLLSEFRRNFATFLVRQEGKGFTFTPKSCF